MKKQLNEKQEAEAIFIREWCLTIINFIYSEYTIDPFLIEMKKEAFSEQTKQKYLSELSPTIYLKGQRQACNDINEMAKDAPPTVLNALNKILMEKFGRSLIDEEKEMKKQINRIAKRGKINNDDEFRLLEQRVSELSQTQPESPEIEALNRLLAEYH